MTVAAPVKLIKSAISDISDLINGITCAAWVHAHYAPGLKLPGMPS
jgi:hypothetical protein